MVVPLFFHTYVGVVPPFVGVAVKVTLVPAHIVVLEAAIVTEGIGKTAIVIPVLVAVVAETHISALGVITQVITSAFAKVVLV